MARRRRKNYNNTFKIILIFFLIGQVIWYYYRSDILYYLNRFQYQAKIANILEQIPDYSAEEYVVLNDNNPRFTVEDFTNINEEYSNLDVLGRCGPALATVGKETMPTEERGSIGGVKPTGWHTVKYDIVDGKYLYNRCHLIGYQLTGENANEKNLITCTRQMNTGVMLDLENKVAKYVNETNNHVLYRVTPVFIDKNLIASGVDIEAMSLEDNGEGLKFNVYVYNVQDGIEIDYQTGESKLKE